MSEQTPGRYTRSIGGLVVAMIVTLVVVALLAGVPALISDKPEAARESVDHLEVVRQAQRSGHRPVYPSHLPEGWVATGAELVPGGGFAMTLLTDDGRYVGVRQEGDDVEDLIEEYVDEGADEGQPFTTDDSVARSWETYSDEGGDTAYAAEVKGLVVLVYGSAGPADLEALVDRLTTAKAPTRTPATPAG